MLLQILTSLVRWSGNYLNWLIKKVFYSYAFILLAFIAMISLACIRIKDPNETHGKPDVANFMGLPNLFGACVYSFMCHHVTPALLVLNIVLLQYTWFCSRYRAW